MPRAAPAIYWERIPAGAFSVKIKRRGRPPDNPRAPPALPGYPRRLERRLERRPGRPPAPARARAAKSLSAKSLSMMLERKIRIWIDSKIPDCKLPLKFPRFFILIPRRRSL